MNALKTSATIAQDSTAPGTTGLENRTDGSPAAAALAAELQGGDAPGQLAGKPRSRRPRPEVTANRSSVNHIARTEGRIGRAGGPPRSNRSSALRHRAACTPALGQRQPLPLAAPPSAPSIGPGNPDRTRRRHSSRSATADPSGQSATTARPPPAPPERRPPERQQSDPANSSPQRVADTLDVIYNAYEQDPLELSRESPVNRRRQQGSDARNERREFRCRTATRPISAHL